MHWAPSPRVEELQGQCRCRGNAPSRLGLWGWGLGWLHAARTSLSPGDAPTAGRVAAQPSGTSLAGPSPPRRLPRLPVGAWARQPPQRSCFWKPEKPRRCPRHLPSSGEVLLPARHLQLSPAVSPPPVPGHIAWRSAAGATRSRRQRCAGESRGGFCARGEDARAVQLGWAGSGRQEGPWIHPRSR